MISDERKKLLREHAKDLWKGMTLTIEDKKYIQDNVGVADGVRVLGERKLTEEEKAEAEKSFQRVLEYFSREENRM